MRLFTRCGYDWTDRYPLIGNAVARHPDGIGGDRRGGGLLRRCRRGSVRDSAQLCLRRPGVSLAFDLLELDGEDWRPRPLQERKARPGRLLAKAHAGIQFSEHLAGEGAAIFAHACKLGCEGIVSKRADSGYRSGPSRVWLKVKNPAAPRVFGLKDEEP